MSILKRKNKVNYKDEYLMLGHYIKYNMYLIYKSNILRTVIDNYKDKSIKDCVDITNEIAKMLDNENLETENR